ncbi:MAG: protein phosphatase 2C domain-containing protein [Chloroflexota bacterium]|nr:protein phosphatase 2C domain-containing protein [Chloroflexota bacterium]
MIEAKKPHLDISAASHPGMTGKQNEDRFQVSASWVSHKKKVPSTLAVLCDGIGGHRAGEIAAQMGVSIITETILKGDTKNPLEIMGEAIRRASAAIYTASQSDKGRTGMGATCAIAWVVGDKLFTANLGDSRIYLLRKGHLVQLTTDHTWVQEAYDAGLIDESERENHPNAHVIRRYLGAKSEPEPDFRLWYFEGERDEDAKNNQGMRLIAGDTLILCSDGLTDLVEDSEIQLVIKENPLDAAVEILIQMANDRGGYDNTTVILMGTPSRGVFKKPRKRRLVMGCLITLALVSAILTAVFFGWHRWQNSLEVLEIQSETQTIVSPTETEIIFQPETSFPAVSPTFTVETPTAEITPQPSITPWPTNTP